METRKTRLLNRNDTDLKHDAEIEAKNGYEVTKLLYNYIDK